MSDSSSREGSALNWPTSIQREGDREPPGDYEPPCVVDLGHVRQVTGGSSGSGRADANSQYYW